VPSRSVNGRYQVHERAESPQHAATPPRSPMKALPTAPDPVTRVAASQKYIKTSATRSPLPSPYLDQPSNGHAKQPRNKDHGHRVKSPNIARGAKSPELIKVARDTDRSLTSKPSQTLRPARSPEPPRSGHSPEPARPGKRSDTTRPVKSPEPGRSSKSPETARQGRSPEPTRAFRSPEPVQEVYGFQAGEQEQRIGSSDSGKPFKTPAEIMARMREVSNPKSAVLERSTSRRRSFSERTLSFLRSKPSDEQEHDTDALSITNLPIQAHSAKATPGKGTPTKQASSPLIRRFSSRKQKAMSMSTYSTSPTSPINPDESPINREASPAYVRNGKPVPNQSTYAQLSLLTVQPMSPLEHSFGNFDDTSSQPAESPVKSSSPAAGSILKTKAALDDSEGNVNTNHPLLQKARHTRFAKNASGDLPLRHYSSHGALTQSNPDLMQQQSEDMPPPKRSSSLLYNPNRRLMGVFPEPPQHSRSPTPNERSTSQATTRSYTTNDRSASQATNRSYTPNHELQNRSAISLITRAHNAPSEAELGIHPAHRTPEPLEPASASTAASSPNPSTTSSVTEHNATPPPIATTRSPTSAAKTKPTSPPSRFAPLALSQQPPRTADDSEPKTKDHWHSHYQPTISNSSNDPLVSTHPEYKTTATTNTPFYLNPASSSALIDFLASTPPPSPPHPGTRTDRAESPSAASNASAAVFNRNFVANHYPKDGEASPPPPGPGARSMTNLRSHQTNGREEDVVAKKKGWKKVFGGGTKSKKPSNSEGLGIRMGRKSKKGKTNVDDGILTGSGPVNGVGEGGGAGGIQTEQGFVGMGKDGVWISRKNFLKT